MKKKMRLKVLLASTATALLLLSGCQSNQTDQTVATYSGGKVTESSFYKELKQSPTTKTMLANMLIYRALNHAYGKSVSTKTVNDAYDSYKQQYGENFDAFLSQNGFSRSSFKESLRTNFLSEVALKKLKRFLKASSRPLGRPISPK